MIRPCVTPIKPKALEESNMQFQQPFNLTSTNQYTISTHKNRLNEQQVSASNSLFPMSAHLDSERSGRIFPKSDSKQERNHQHMPTKFKDHVQALFQQFSKSNTKELKLIKSDIEKIRSGMVELNQKCKNYDEENIKRIVTTTVQNLTEGKKLISLKQGLKLQTRFHSVDQKIFQLQQYYVQNMQKAYMQVKQITNCMQTLSLKLETMQQQNIARMINLQQKIKILPPEKEASLNKNESMSYKLDLSKINIQQPQSIVSGYENSELKSIINENKESSFIKKLDTVIDASSQMIVFGDQGDITDIKGLPIVNKSGNLVIVNVKQIKKILNKPSESSLPPN